MKIDIRMLDQASAEVLEQVAPGVFDHPVNPQLAAEFLSDPRHHLAVALADDNVVGMASAVHYVHPDKPAELWINEVGVDDDYRRRGIGRGLLQALFDLAQDLGCVEAWVATEPDNTAARGLYQSVGGAAEPAVVYSFRLGNRDTAGT